MMNNMKSLVSEKHLPATSSEPGERNINESDHHQEADIGHDNSNRVTSHLYLKPGTHSAGTLDREVVLRRIRHRKRVHNVKKALQALISSPFSSKNVDSKASSVPDQIIKWADDAFAAP